MGDIAQILADTAAGTSIAPVFGGGTTSSGAPPRAIKMMGMSKEVMDLLVGSNHDPVSAALPPIVPAFNRPPAKEGGPHPQNGAADGPDSANHQQNDAKVKVGTKWVSTAKRARPWTWAPFASSSRTDGATFRHWVRAGVEYTDYPYAKFDVHLDPVVYSDDEYRLHLQSDAWTQSETDRLMELARTLELRWPVIHDRWYDLFCCGQDAPQPTSPPGDGTRPPTTADPSSSRRIEDLQHRYYQVAATLSQVRIAQEAAKEVQSLAAAAAAAAAAASSSKAAAALAGPGGGAPTPADAANSLHRGKTEAALLESAAARALATSAGKHQPVIANVGTGSTNKTFNVSHERERRHQLDRMWNRSKEEEAEEMELRRELKLIDAQLRKLKKSGGHIVAASTSAAAAAAASGRASGAAGPGGILPGFASGGPGSRLPSAASSRNPSRSVSPAPGSAMAGRAAVGGGFVANPSIADDPAILDMTFASIAPVPVPQTPYLQSARLAPPAAGGSAGLNKALLKRMDLVLSELNIPARPLPTKRVCDVYDTVRKDIITLLTLQKLVLQREGQLQAKRVKLSKLGVSTLAPEDKVLDEERLLGIVPPPPKQPVQAAAAASAAAAAAAAVSKAKPTKKKAATGGGTVNAKASKKSAPAGPAAEGSSDAATTKTKSDGKEGGAAAGAAATVTAKKKTVKRKRKSETTKSPTPASASAAAAKAGAPSSGAAAIPNTNSSVPSAGPQPAAVSKKTSTVPGPPVAIAPSASKLVKVATSSAAAAPATTTTTIPAKTESATPSSSNPTASSSGDAAKQTGGAKKRARKS
jgi:DNA methyltransferase 1-associated protein 1